ncbi:TauD/TfdA family dioxygenase [Pseudomonas amygdali]
MDVCLCNPGDTLIVDNWRMLHGRSAVPTSAMRRQLERIYISELWPNL